MKLRLLALAAVVVATAAAAQQDAWTQQVRRQLQEFGARFEDQGYRMIHRIYTGALDDGESEAVELSLDIGTEYQIVGACDEDCTDLDFVLYDGSGREVDSDLLEDDVPVVAVTVTRSGAFRLRVAMAACSEEPCRYGIGVFGK
jgi:hypothetical protein